MFSYRFRAFNRAGSVVAGELRAADSTAVMQTLSQWNLQPLRISQTKPPGAIRRLFAMNRDDVITGFLADIADLLESSLPLDKALAQVRLSSRWQVAEIADVLSHSINQGSSFSQALWQAGLLDESACRLVEVAESSGAIGNGLVSVVSNRRSSRDFRRRLWRVCAYPLLMILVLVFLVVFLLLSVLPSLIDFLSGLDQPLPYSVSLIAGLTEQLSAGAIAIFFAILLLPMLLMWLPAMPDSLQLYRDKLWVRLPLVGRLCVLSFRVQFSRELATFTGAGLDLVPALASIANSTRNRYIKQNTQVILHELQDGLSLATAMRCSGLFCKPCIHVVAMGESTGDYSEPFDKLQRLNSAVISQWFDRVERRVGPVLLSVAGLLILWIVVVVISPMYQVALGVGSSL